MFFIAVEIAQKTPDYDEIPSPILKASDHDLAKISQVKIISNQSINKPRRVGRTGMRRKEEGWMDTYVNNFKETSFRPSSIGSDSRGTDGRTQRGSFVRSDSQSDVSLSLYSSFSVVVVVVVVVRHLTQISRKRHI